MDPLSLEPLTLSCLAKRSTASSSRPRLRSSPLCVCVEETPPSLRHRHGDQPRAKQATRSRIPGMPEGRKSEPTRSYKSPAPAHTEAMSAEHGHDRTGRRLARPLCRILCRSRRSVCRANATRDGQLTYPECTGTAYEGGRFVVDIGSSFPSFLSRRSPLNEFQLLTFLRVGGVQWHPRGIRSNRSK